MTTTQDTPFGTGASVGDAGSGDAGRDYPAGLVNLAESSYSERVFDHQLCELASLEHAHALLAYREITALITAHRHAYTMLPGGTRPGSARPHRNGLPDRGDAWLNARELVLCEYAPDCGLSLRTAARRLDKALNAGENFPDTVAALARKGSGVTAAKLNILLSETTALTGEQKTAVEKLVLPHAPADTSVTWARRIREAIITVLGAPLAAKTRRDREDARYVTIVPDGMVAQLLGELPAAQAKALDLALDALADTAEADDPRTRDQLRADALVTCVLGPAVFHAPSSADSGTAGGSGTGGSGGSGTGGSGTGGTAGGSRGDDADGSEPAARLATDTDESAGRPEPRDEDEPAPDYAYGHVDPRRTDPHAGADTGDNQTDGSESDRDDVDTGDNDTDGLDQDIPVDSSEADSALTTTATSSVAHDNTPDPYADLLLPPAADGDEPDFTFYKPEHDSDRLTQALWGHERVLPLIDPGEVARVSELWELIRQLTAHLNFTVPRPPEVHLDVTIPVDLLAGSDHDGTSVPPSDTDHEGAGRTRVPGASANSTRSDRTGDTDDGTSVPTGGRPHDGDAGDAEFEARHGAVLDGIGPVDPDLARHLARDARWRRVLADPVTGIVYDVGKTRYRVPADMRRRVTTRDKTCRFPGCTRKAQYCHLDHVVEFPLGPTADHQLACLCALHHRVKHQTGWQLVLHDDASIDWTSSTGRRYTTYPAGRTAPPRTIKKSRKHKKTSEGKNRVR